MRIEWAKLHVTGVNMGKTYVRDRKSNNNNKYNDKECDHTNRSAYNRSIKSRDSLPAQHCSKW